METAKITGFLKQNYIAFIVGICFFALYLFFTFSGNRLCGCEDTEKYNPRRTGGTYYRTNRIYHK
jgi:hypothetical protein